MDAHKQETAKYFGIYPTIWNKGREIHGSLNAQIQKMAVRRARRVAKMRLNKEVSAI